LVIVLSIYLHFYALAARPNNEQKYTPGI